MQCVHARLLWSESSGKGGRVCDPNHNAPAVCLLREGGLHASVDAVEAKCRLMSARYPVYIYVISLLS